MSEPIAEAITEDAIEAVADQIDHVEEAVRSLSGVKLAYTGFGIAIGAAAGAFVAWKVAYSRAEEEFSERTADEIAEMRKHYRAKVTALEAQAHKVKPVKDIVAKKGYAPVEEVEEEGPSPMAVTPPASVVEAARETEAAEVTRTPDVSDEPIVVRPAPAKNMNVFVEHGDKSDWDYVEERKKRSPDKPYIIHVDERSEFPDYDEHTLTYYEGDDVLCDHRDEIIGHERRHAIIGEGSLVSFGHGSPDPDIVYVRNDELEIVYEIIRSDKEYAEEVHGFTHSIHDRKNLERMRDRERRAFEDD